MRSLPLLFICSALLALSLLGCVAPAPEKKAPEKQQETGEGEPETIEPEDLSRDPSCDQGNWVVQFFGEIIDEAGEPFSDAHYQMCVKTQSRTLICLNPSLSDEGGQFKIDVPKNARCMNYATARVLKLDEDYATTYCPMEIPDVPVQSASAPFTLFATEAAEVLPPMGNVEAKRTVIFADGLEATLSPDSFFGPYRAYEPGERDSYNELAARRLDPETEGLCFVPLDLELEGLYAFSPEGNVKDINVDLKIPNSTELEPGTWVDLYVLGGLSCETLSGGSVTEGDFSKFATVPVGEDGQYIEAKGENGLPCLNWFGYAVSSESPESP